MREVIGFAAKVAAVIFGLALVGSLFWGMRPGERLMLAAMPAMTAFIAALILGARDRARQAGTVRAVRRLLLARDDVTDADFVAHFPEIDPALMDRTRRVVSRFFDVPTAKIHPDDRPSADLRMDALDPRMKANVVCEVFNARAASAQPFALNTAGLNDLGDLADRIQGVLDDVDSVRLERIEPTGRFRRFKSPRFMDPELGELRRSGGTWVGMLSIDDALNVPVVIPGSRAGPDLVALRVARSIPSELPSWRPKIARELFEHYSPYAEAVAAGELEPPDEGPPAIDGPSSVWPYTTIEFIQVDQELTIVIGLRVTWDEEHLLGAFLRDGEVAELSGSI